MRSWRWIMKPSIHFTVFHLANGACIWLSKSCKHFIQKDDEYQTILSKSNASWCPTSWVTRLEIKFSGRRWSYCTKALHDVHSPWDINGEENGQILIFSLNPFNTYFRIIASLPTYVCAYLHCISQVSKLLICNRYVEMGIEVNWDEFSGRQIINGSIMHTL